MSQHPNAKLTPKGRETLVSRIESGLGVAEAARQMGVSRQTTGKWLRRSRSGEGLSGRSSRPRRLARLTPADVEDRVCEARSSMMLAPLGLAAATGVPARTCARIVARRGMPRLADVDRVTGEVRRRGPVTRVRYERESPGELVHVDVKKVPRIPDGGGRRALGRGRRLPARRRRRPRQGRLRRAAARRAQGHLRGVHGALLRFFEGMGVRAGRVMTDNGPGCRSGEFNALLESEGARHIHTKPFSPWQNGKVERMNRTLAQEWKYARARDGEAGRAEALPAFIERYNWERPHSACGGLPPMSRIVDVNNLSAHNT